MVALDPILKKAYWTLAALGGFYAIFILFLINPTFQRHSLYAHKFHTGYYGYLHNVSNPESFGFARNQITPFNLSTPDEETLYCWHILPLDVYAKHEREITAQPSGAVADLTQTVGYRLLKEDPQSRVVVNFHGNAGHVAQGWRTGTYASLTTLPHTHILTCDYRGFGHSTGIPSEAGLITDGIALVSYVLNTLSHPSTRTLLLGQSLGTAVTSAVSLYYTSPQSSLLPAAIISAESQETYRFAGVVLVAPFPSIPLLLRTYRIRGLIPILSPLRPYPYLSSLLEARIIDKWPSGARLVALVKAARETGLGVRVTIVHARDDADINWKLGEDVYAGMEMAMVGDAGVAKTEERKSVVGFERVTRGAVVYRAVEDWPVDGRGVDGGRVVELEVVRYGGHNRVVTYSPVTLAVMRAFDSVHD